MKLFSGNESLDTPFNAAYVRINPYDADEQLKDIGLSRGQAYSEFSRRSWD